MFIINYYSDVMIVCVFQGGCLMAVGLGVAAAGFAGEHICFGPLCMHPFGDLCVIKPHVT